MGGGVGGRVGSDTRVKVFTSPSAGSNRLAILEADRYPIEEDWIMAMTSASVRLAAGVAAPPAPRASAKSLTIGVVGAGRVGTAMGAAFAHAGHTITGASGRSDLAVARIEAFLPGTPHRRAEDVVRAADLVIFAVPDDALAPLVAHLGESGAFRPGVIVAHTSGSHGIGILHPATARGALPLALHPAMTFTGAADDIDRLTSGISFGVTAPDDLKPLVTQLVAELGGSPEWIPDDRRALYHTALAHGANHLVTLVNEAMDRLRDAGVIHPEKVLGPLLHAALDNTLAMGDGALTGPVSRGDAGTIAKHLDTLAATAPDSVPTYLALARRTADRAIASGRLSPMDAESLLGVLASQPAEF
jgi:predicted short-subunit dehydrogenase-like oxidoreductase (DUF2520 family)